MKKALIFVGIAGAVTGIVFYYKKQIAMLEDFDYKIIGFKVDHVKEEDALIYITFRVFNKSKLQAVITDLNLDVLLDQVKIASIEEARQILVPANGYSDVEIKVAFSPKNIGQNIVNLAIGFAGKMDTFIQLNGYMKLKAGFIKTSVPFSYNTSVKEMFS
jgi:LEA14-like dessication related protein